MVKVTHFVSYTFDPLIFDKLLFDNIECLPPSTNKNKQVNKVTEGKVAMKEEFKPQNSSIFIYRQDFQGFRSIGVIGAINIQDYQNGIIKKHEKTLDRAGINAQTYRQNYIGPVTLAYDGKLAQSEAIDRIINSIIDSKILNIFSQWKTIDGREHTLWRIQQKNQYTFKFSKQIINFMDSIKSVYILDGHHRFQAAQQNYILYKNKKQNQNNIYRNQKFIKQQWIQGILFSSKNVMVHSQHRKLVSFPQHLNQNQFITYIRSLDVKIFNLSKNYFKQTTQQNKKIQFKYSQNNQIIQYDIIFVSKSNILGIKINNHENDINPTNFNVQKLPAKFLDQNILMPLYNFEKKQLQKHLEFVPGINLFNQQSIKKILVQNSQKQIEHYFFIIKPLSIQQLFEIADNNYILPPKSTWMQPKPCLKMIVTNQSINVYE